MATAVATKMPSNLKAMKKRMTGKRSKRNFTRGAGLDLGKN
jgi:hypothetical protein